jgi:hypothetical protein
MDPATRGLLGALGAELAGQRKRLKPV